MNEYKRVILSANRDTDFENQEGIRDLPAALQEPMILRIKRRMLKDKDTLLKLAKCAEYGNSLNDGNECDNLIGAASWGLAKHTENCIRSNGCWDHYRDWLTKVTHENTEEFYELDFKTLDLFLR